MVLFSCLFAHYRHFFAISILFWAYSPPPSFSFALSREAEGLRQRKVGIIRADHINSGGDKREEVYLPDSCRYTSNIDERWLLLHSDKIVILLAALYEVQSVAKEYDVVILFHILDAFKLPATALFEWGRGEVAELVYRLTLIDWEPIRAIITSSGAEMEAWPFRALVSPSFIPLTL